MLADLHAGLAAALGVASFRALPLVCALCRQSAVPPWQRASACVVYAACVYFGVHESDFDARRTLLAYLWLVPIALATYAFCSRFARVRLFCLCFCGLLVIPSVLFHGD